MNLRHVKLLKEDDKTWHVHNVRTGDRFHVAKNGLSDGLTRQIAQHFAEGGEVEGDSPQASPDEQAFMAAAELPGKTGQEMRGRIGDALQAQRTRGPGLLRSLGQDLEAGTAPFTDPIANIIKAKEGERGEALNREAGNALSDFGRDLSAGSGGVGNLLQNPFQSAIQAGEEKNSARGLVSNAVGPNGLPTVPPGAGGGQPGATAAPAPGQPTPGQPQPPSQPGAGGGMGGMSAFDKAIRESGKAESESIDKRTDIASKMAAEHLKLQQDYQKQQADTSAHWEELAKKNLADIDKTQKELASGNIDPHHWWNTRNTGQKIATTIGMILGGIGQAFGGGPNATLQMVNKAIDQDIDAQKANLGKKQSLLSGYLSQGHSIQQAENLVRAHQLAAVTGQMEMVASKYGGPQAQAIAQAMKAQIGKGVYEETMKAHMLGGQAALQGLQIQATKQNMALQTQQMKLLGATLGGGQVDPRAIALLPKEVQEKLVNMPDGSYATAKTPKDAEDVRTTQEATDVLTKKLQRYGQLLQANPHGISSALTPKEFQEAKSLRNSMLTDLNGLSGLKRFTHEENEIFQGRIPDITNFKFRSAGDVAAIQELDKEIREKVGASNRSFLNLPTPKGTKSQERYP